MKVDVTGRVHNVSLPKTHPLLPLFEAVVNAFHAIEDARDSTPAPRIEIDIQRDGTLPGIPGRVGGFVISDNGVGFNAKNLDAFFTSDTRSKATRGGKGIGRFTWLKAFEYAQIESHFQADGKLLKREFTFTTQTEEPTSVPTESDRVEPLTTVRLVGMKVEFAENCPQQIKTIAHRIVAHCLHFFLDPKCPIVIIRDADDAISLNEYFRDTLITRASQHEFAVDEVPFTLKGLRLHNSYETQHRLLYAADCREVISEELKKYRPNLQRHLEDNDGPFVYLAIVEGKFLDEHVDSDRSHFTFSASRDPENLFEEVTLDSIREGALNCVSRDLGPLLQEINQEKTRIVTTFIDEQAPQYKPLKRYMPEFIDAIPPNVTGGFALDTALHQQMYERQRSIREEGEKLIKEAVRPEDYEAKIANFLERANELGKSSLAQYVAHRKVILDFFEKSLFSDPNTGRYSLEEAVHRIIYPMRAVSDEVAYDQQNLWIIDERLTYHWYLASDKQISSMKPLDNTSKSRPDLLIFDRALPFGEERNEPLSSVVVIEFKRPERQGYSNDNPIDQILGVVDDIQKGRFRDHHGRQVSVRAANIPAYAYLICDRNEEIEKIARYKGLIPTPDGEGWYAYNQALYTYIEVIPYNKLLRDAKKRNRILFEKLNLPAR